MREIPELEAPLGDYLWRMDLPSIEFNNEDAYHPSSDEFDCRLVVVECPVCGRRCSPFLSRAIRHIRSGWRWVGLDHREPYAEWYCRCPGCRENFILTTVTPQ